MRTFVGYMLILFLLLGFVDKAFGQKVPAMFVFGDSIADVGTNNYISNLFLPKEADVFPYGETFPGSPTGRWCDGKLIVDFIADHLSLASPGPYLKPNVDFSKGVSFASFGSGVLDITGQLLGVISFPHQVRQFEDVVTTLKKELGDDAANEIIKKSFYVIFAASNDITDYPLVEGQYAEDNYIDMLVSSLKSNIQTLVNQGAQKIMIAGVGPLGCVPSARASIGSGDCNEQLNTMTQTFNAAMLDYVNDFNSESSTTKIILGPIYDFTLNMIENGGSSGFPEGTTACCGNGLYNGVLLSCGQGSYTMCSNVDEHIFWDFTHPTQHFYSVIADLYWSGAIDHVTPMSISQLVELEL